MEEILYGVIKDPPRLPFTLGIFGEWGSGKTTLMEMIRRRLENDGRVKAVWFNAWKYDSKEVIWNALIQKIFYVMRSDEDVRHTTDLEAFRKRVGDVAKGLAIYAGKVATRLVPGGIVREEDVDAVVGLLATSATDETFDFINRFEENFNALVEEYVGDGFLVVFVDDLDRCLPENAINVMEALKLYLDQARCIFVIGAESGIIEEGIRQRYKSNVRLSAEDYLDKIVQLPFMLPQADADTAMSLLADHAQFEGHGDARMRDLIVLGSGGNPRRVKRFSNALWVVSQIAGRPQKEGHMQLAKVLMIQMRFPKLFRLLVDDPGLAQRLTDVLEAGPQERDRAREIAGEDINALYDDAELTRFLAGTRHIPLPERDIRPWVQLTNTQIATAESAT
jgi:KAP family P-loop domain